MMNIFSKLNKLRLYQVIDLAFYMANPKCLNLSDPGCGKTPPTCVYMWWLWTEKNVRTMWVMPKSLLKKNRDELLEFTPFDPEDIVIFDGTPKQRQQILETSNAKVWLMGFRRFADDWETLWEEVGGFDCLAVDELHMGFGGATSNQTKQFWRANKFFTYMVGMTGTLIRGRLDSAYPVLHAIEPRYYPSHANFIYVHGNTDIYGNVYSWKNHDILAKRISLHSIRRSFTEVYGKNEVVTHVEKVSMTKRQAEVYNEWEDAALLEIEDGFLDTPNMAVHALRCRQILAHPEKVMLPDKVDPITGKTISFKEHNLVGKETIGKDEQLLIHLADHKNTGEPLIIYGCFQIELERIAKLCEDQGFRVGLIHGGVPTKKRVEIDEGFRAGRIDIVVASPATAAIGFNWGHVDHIVFASLDYQDSNYLQARRRAERGVRERALRVTVLEYEDTIEQRIFSIIERKSRDANKVDPTTEKVRLIDDR